MEVKGKTRVVLELSSDNATGPDFGEALPLLDAIFWQQERTGGLAPPDGYGSK